MDIIYTPKGKALEYAKLALNIYKGCTHGCKYCYASKTPWKSPGKYFSGSYPKNDLINRVTKDCISLIKKPEPVPEILISFIGDPYQPMEMDLHLTRETIQTLINFDLPFSILTKGGMYAVRDFDLLAGYGKARFGTTLCFMDQNMADEWEPGAARIQSRIMAIEEAKRRHIPTWISLEPVIDPDEALRVIDALHPLVDHWKIGKLNHHRGIENSVNWRLFRDRATSLLDSLNAGYYLKDSLSKG
jgi:DNA repair photolyase